MAKKSSPRSKIPSPDFRAPYVKMDKNGNIHTPESQYVRGTQPNSGSLCKSKIPIGDLAIDIVRKYNIDKSNLTTVGRSICQDYAHLEDIDYNLLYQEIAAIIEGPTKIPEGVNPQLVEYFRNTHRDWNSKGESHPDTLHNKEKFEELYEGHIPKDIWGLPLRQAEEAFITWVQDTILMGEAVDQVEAEEQEKTDGFLVIPVKVTPPNTQNTI